MIVKKYLINLSLDVIIDWKVDKVITAFGLRFGRELKWFYADASDLIMLKNHLRNYTKFTNF